MADANAVDPRCKKLVRESGIRMIESGLTVYTWGNVSYCDRSTGLVYITPSGMDYHELTDDDICVYELSGAHVEGDRRPSIELQMHLGCLNARPEMNAVVHTHPIFSTVFSSMGEDIPINIHDEAAQTLGLSRAQTFFSVLLPQTAKRVLLPVTNEVITLVKDTALASTIAVADLMSQAERQVSNSSSIEPYIVAMLIYLVINGVVEQLCKLAERKFNYYQ